MVHEHFFSTSEFIIKKKIEHFQTRTKEFVEKREVKAMLLSWAEGCPGSLAGFWW